MFHNSRTKSKASVFSSFASNEREQMKLDEFFEQETNFIILTNAGKPIYAMHGDIYSLSSIFATLYAMISKVQTFRFEEIDLKLPKRQNSGVSDRPKGIYGQGLYMSTLTTSQYSQSNHGNSSPVNSYDDRNMSLAYGGESDFMNDSMVKERETKHREKQAFNDWKEQNLKPKPPSSMFSAIAGQVYKRMNEPEQHPTESTQEPLLPQTEAPDEVHIQKFYNMFEGQAQLEEEAERRIMDLSTFKEEKKIT